MGEYSRTLTVEQAQQRLAEIEAHAIEFFGSWGGFVAYAQAWKLPAAQRAEYEEYEWLSWMVLRALRAKELEDEYEQR